MFISMCVHGRPGPNLAPLVVGLAVFLAHIVLIPITGCGINPVIDDRVSVQVIFYGNGYGERYGNGYG